jgi:hypothetical protein
LPLNLALAVPQQYLEGTGAGNEVA